MLPNDYVKTFIVTTAFNSYLFQPPAFPEETSESIKEFIEEKYLTPRLDPDEFSPEKAGRDWDFDWFSKAKIPVEPSLPRTAVFPEWELPFRRSKQGKWEPRSVQVCPQFCYTLGWQLPLLVCLFVCCSFIYIYVICI